MFLIYSSFSEGGVGYSFDITRQLLQVAEGASENKWSQDWAAELRSKAAEVIEGPFLGVLSVDAVWQRQPSFRHRPKTLRDNTFAIRKIFKFEVDCFLSLELLIRIKIV
jgi:hypothetical protein